MREYIKRGWRTLARSNRDLAAAAADPKFPPADGGRWPVYVSRSEDLSGVERLLRAQMPATDFARLAIRRLPEGAGAFEEPGLLYLPRPYVVPGGRFNEMYGWTAISYQVGLLRDGDLGLARDMVDNSLYQIEHYGKILNANHSYYLTRSQPPFLTRMILGVYRRKKDTGWLRRAVPAVERYYRLSVSKISSGQPIEACSFYFEAHQLPSIQPLRSTFQPITLMPPSDSDDAIRQPAGEK